MKFLQKTAAVMLAGMLLFSAVPQVHAEGENQPEIVENVDENGVTYTEVDEIVYAVITVNIRTGPNTSYQRLDALPMGNSIRRVAIGSNGWSKVLYNGEICYMFSDYLSTGKINMALDTDKLSRQIAIANGLDQSKYTKESVDAMLTELAAAKLALNGGTQATIDATAKSLETAIAALVEMDYTSLHAALQAVEEFSGNDPLFKDLLKAMDKGMEQLSGTDQASVDAAAEQIFAALEAMKAQLEELSKPQIITQEVQVEVPPSGDFCNIPKHQLWPVLTAASAVLNVGLLAIIAVYITKKLKKHRDDTPLVDYDITDDAWQ